jgi:CRISPR-associated protein Cas1
MIKRTVEISSGPAHLAVRDAQLLLTRQREAIARIPCEDLGVLVVDQSAVTYSHAALTTLAANGSAVVLCGPDHHPAALLLPYDGNALHTERLRIQVESSRPAAKRIWQQIIQAKINAQADVLGAEHATQRRLRHLAGQVRSGDTSNVEAQAARVYWPALFSNIDFRRDPNGPSPNNLLN